MSEPVPVDVAPSSPTPPESTAKANVPLSDRSKVTAARKSLNEIQTEAFEAEVSLNGARFEGWDKDVLARVAYIEKQCALIRLTLARPYRA